jgi:hypothetical protein
MTSAHPKFEKGKQMLNANELCKAGRFCVELHNYYILNWKKIDVIVVKYRQSHLLTDDDVFIISLSNLYDLFNHWMYLSCAASCCKSTRTSLFNTLNIHFTCA